MELKFTKKRKQPKVI